MTPTEIIKDLQNKALDKCVEVCLKKESTIKTIIENK